MKFLISGHRLFKLEKYSIEFIKIAIEDTIEQIVKKFGAGVGLSGMASGVDLWFCDACLLKNIPYQACIPFEEQKFEMSQEESFHRDELINKAIMVRQVRNSFMVSIASCGIIVWDGNKGGTHNVFQQMIENKKPFLWINPVSEKIIEV